LLYTYPYRIQKMSLIAPQPFLTKLSKPRFMYKKKGSVAKTSKKYVNLQVMNKNQDIQGKCTNIIKLYQTTD